VQFMKVVMVVSYRR